MNSVSDHYGAARPDPKHPETVKDWSGWQRALLSFASRHLGREETYPHEPIWLPGESDFQAAFQRYLDELRTRPRLPGEDVKVEGGRVSLQGLASVMAVNGYVMREVFNHNKDHHAFYIEESYTIPWMYPYLEPYGIILKINDEPLPQLTPAMVARDRAYWDALVADFHDDPRFGRDDTAQEAFSKLRSAIGGLYAFRRMAAEAEYAYKQAIALCPDGPDGNFHLAQLYVESGRFDDAVDVLEEYQRRDPYNPRIRGGIQIVRELRRLTGEAHELEREYNAQPGDLLLAVQLIDSYVKLQQTDAIDGIVTALLSGPNPPPEFFLQIAQRYLSLGRPDRATDLLAVMTQRYPQSQVAWYNLGLVHTSRRNCDAAVVALNTRSRSTTQIIMSSKRFAMINAWTTAVSILNSCKCSPSKLTSRPPPLTAGRHPDQPLIPVRSRPFSLHWKNLARVVLFRAIIDEDRTKQLPPTPLGLALLSLKSAILEGATWRYEQLVTVAVNAGASDEQIDLVAHEAIEALFARAEQPITPRNLTHLSPAGYFRR